MSVCYGENRVGFHAWLLELEQLTLEYSTEPFSNNTSATYGKCAEVDASREKPTTILHNVVALRIKETDAGRKPRAQSCGVYG